MTRRLVIRPGAIGDVIVALPSLLAANANEIWTPAALVPLLRLAGFEHVRAISGTGLDLVSIRGLEACPALREFDEILSWYGTHHDDFRVAVSALPIRFFEALPSPGSILHSTDFFLRQLRASEGERSRIGVARERADYAVIHPFSGGRRKNWPLEWFREVARSLPMEVRWTASPEEPLDGATRFEDLAELAKFLAAARLYIGNDSGISHLAAAVGTPTIAIFGPTEPRVWGPRGPHVEIITPPDRSDLMALSPAMVLERARSLLARS